jgi:hypothetical protein
MAEEIGPIVLDVSGKLPMALYQHRCGQVEWWRQAEGPESGGCDACESGSPYVSDWRLLYAAPWPDEHRETGEHAYLSTACLHAQTVADPDEAKRLHGRCQSMTGTQGEKKPATCKFCDARCVCECHRTPAVEPVAVERRSDGANKISDIGERAQS